MMFIALALAASIPNTTGPAMSSWANCMTAYAKPRLRNESTVRLVDGGFAACQIQEITAHKAWDHDMGPNIFVGIKYRVRGIMLRRIDEAKRMRGIQ